jgi:hypothetical protein
VVTAATRSRVSTTDAACLVRAQTSRRCDRDHGFGVSLEDGAERLRSNLGHTATHPRVGDIRSSGVRFLRERRTLGFTREHASCPADSRAPVRGGALVIDGDTPRVLRRHSDRGLGARPDGESDRHLRCALAALTRATASTGGMPEASRERVSVLPAVGTRRHSARCFSGSASHAPSAMARRPRACSWPDQSSRPPRGAMRWFVVARRHVPWTYAAV